MNVHQKIRRVSATVMSAAVLAACGGGGGSSSVYTPPPPVATINHRLVSKASTEAAGANCANGGARIDSGLDVNNNGLLDTSEIKTTQYVCDGANGTNGANGLNGHNALLNSSTEPAGANCVNGGFKLLAGVDANANGTLDAAEVSSTQYVCNAADGTGVGTTGAAGLNSLMVVAAEPAGANCAYGGSKVTTGLDSNANNALEASEVVATAYLCSGPPTSVAWLRASADVQALPNTGYLADSATQLTITLPVAPNLGDIVAVNGVGLGGWKIAQNAGQSINRKSLNPLAGATWNPSALAPKAWLSVASSADGSKLVAAEDGGSLYTSVDSGVTWTPRDSGVAGAHLWYSVASSADGNKLVAADTGGYVYTSADSGATWTLHDSLRDWYAVASSADGVNLVALANFGALYTSSDSGQTWVDRLTSTLRLNAVASSADGTKLVATSTVGGLIYTSIDSGAIWVASAALPGTTVSTTYRAVASSADGNKLVTAAFDGRIYTSPDRGVTWTARDSARKWVGVASSADGQNLVALETAFSGIGGLIYTSSDSGVTWTPRDSPRNWSAVASSADGSKQVAMDYGIVPAVGGLVYTAAPQTTLGTAGYITGAQYDTLELQYLWNGLWNIRQHEGALKYN